MHLLLRTCLVGLLVASLVEAPVLASPSAPLGVVIEAEHARLGTAQAFGGATVFAGETLATEPAGKLRVRVGTAQLYLSADSAAALSDAAAGLSAALVRGTLGFSSSGTDRIEVRASDAIIRPKTAQPTHGQVTLVSPDEVVVTSYSGALEILVDGEVYSVPAASSSRVILEDTPQEPEGAGKESAKHRRALLYTLVVAGVAAGVGIGVWRALVSPDRP